MPITTTGFSHVRLTVRDIEVSRRFYDAVFGWDVAYEVPADADEATREQLWFVFDGVIYQVPGGLLGLRPVAPGDDAFDEDRVGLDHLSSSGAPRGAPRAPPPRGGGARGGPRGRGAPFSVASRADLAAATAVRDAAGVEHGGVKDAGTMHLLEFRDPDGIALELVAAKG